MSDQTYPITGIPVVPGEPNPVRQEINAWSGNEDNAIQVSLYIQALTKFEKMSHTEKLSYFQIAGIHGYPTVPWDGVPGGFFCAHNTITFPTWHRPYMLLFEQRLYEIMLQEVIPELFPTGSSESEREKWILSAKQWRLPYYDWAAKQPPKPPSTTAQYSVPDLLTTPKVTIYMPGGKPKKEMDNPLWQFTNPSKKPMGDKSMGKYAIKADDPYPWNECIATSKYGIFTEEIDPQKKWVEGVQNWQTVNIALNDPQWYGDVEPLSIGEAVHRMLSPGYFESYETFASTKHNPVNCKGTNYLSLEYIHNNLHNFIGGTDMKSPSQGAGHMSDVPVAAFDPIFWLHHCNVDRLFAIWQILNDPMWFSLIPIDRADPKPSDPLQPFHYDLLSSTYNSDKVRDWQNLHYQYDTLVPDKSCYDEHGNLIRDEYLALVRRRVNDLYDTTPKELVRLPHASPEDGFPGGENDYIINIVYDRYALGGKSYTIHFYIGDSADVAELRNYSRHTNHVGSVYTFSGGSAEQATGCSNCDDQKSRKVLSKAQVPITYTLYRRVKDSNRSGLPNLLPDNVVHYLKAQLNWRIVQAPGVEVDARDLPETKIFVMQGFANRPHRRSLLPSYSDYTPLWEVTEDKRTHGGAGPGDGLA